MARYCARWKVGPKDVSEVGWNPASGGMDVLEGLPASALGKRDGRVAFLPEGREELSETSAGSLNLGTDKDGGLESSSL